MPFTKFEPFEVQCKVVVSPPLSFAWVYAGYLCLWRFCFYKGSFNLYTQGLFVVVNTRNECKYCQTSDQNVFNSLTQKMNLPFQRPTADSLALSVVCLLTVRVLDISDKKKNKNKIQRKNKLDRTKTIKKRFN